MDTNPEVKKKAKQEEAADEDLRDPTKKKKNKKKKKKKKIESTDASSVKSSNSLDVSLASATSPRTSPKSKSAKKRASTSSSVSPTQTRPKKHHPKSSGNRRSSKKTEPNSPSKSTEENRGVLRTHSDEPELTRGLSRKNSRSPSTLRDGRRAGLGSNSNHGFPGERKFQGRGGGPRRGRSGDLEMLKRDLSTRKSAVERERKAPPRSRSVEFQRQISRSSRRPSNGGLDGSGPKSILRNSSHHSSGPRSSLRNSSHHSSSLTKSVHVVEYDEGESNMSSSEEVDVKFDRRAVLKKRTSSFMLGFSTRSQLSIDKTREFEDDTIQQTVLRYFHILPPVRDEKPDMKKIRIYIWCALILDFVAAIVSIATYDGVAECCGVPIYDVVAKVNWNVGIRVLTWIYLTAVFLEVIAVLRTGIPFNLINPVMGFIIFFAMFFDDRTFEAISMWIIEASAIFFEFLVYRRYASIYQDKQSRLEEVEKELKGVKASKRSIRTLKYEGDSSDDSMSDDSFMGDEESSKVSTKDIKKLKMREFRLLRERRQLSQTQKQARIHMRYHFTGSTLNLGLAGVSLLLVIVIAKNKGLCIADFEKPKVFASDQLETCYLCRGATTGSNPCEICDDPDGRIHCYYPYY